MHTALEAKKYMLMSTRVLHNLGKLLDTKPWKVGSCPSGNATTLTSGLDTRNHLSLIYSTGWDVIPLPEFQYPSTPTLETAQVLMDISA